MKPHGFSVIFPGIVAELMVFSTYSTLTYVFNDHLVPATYVWR